MKLLRIINTKLIPLTLSAAIIINVQIPLYAQQKPYVAVQDNTRVAKVNVTLANAYTQSQGASGLLSYEQVKQEALKLNNNQPLSEDVIQAIYQQYLQDVNKQDSEVSRAFQLSKNDFHLDYYLNEAYKQGGRVCIDKKCYEQANFVQGILRASLYQGLDEGSSSKQYKWNREVMLAEIPNIYSALEMGGVHRKDAAKLQKYTKFILEKADDYCDNDTYLVDIMPGLGTSFSGKSNGRKSDAEKGKETRRKQCENVGKALVVLGMAGQTVQERGANAAIIYKVMKDTYKDDYGAITAMNGAAGLIAAGTVSSYNYLDRFLTVDTLKGATDFGTFWNGCKWVLDLLSVQKWIEKGTTVNNRLRGRGGRYLNQLGAVYQYIDEDAARAMGISDYQVGVMKTHPSLGYNIPYRNVLEDLGILVSTTGTKQGNQIAAKILSIYASNVKRSGNAMDEVHTPLVAGVLSTGIIKDANAQYAAQKINNLDWWDLNEATQRRVNNIATKYSGTLSRNKDAAKIKRNENNQKIIQAGFWADMAITAVFMGMLVASIPNMVRSAANFARNVSRIRAINAAGKGNLLKIVRVNIKASGIKPANVKMARQAKQAEAAEVARAERLLKQKGIKKDAYGNPLKQANAADVKTAAAKVKAVKQPAPKNIKIKLTDGNGASAEAVASYSDKGKLTLKLEPNKSAAAKMEGTLQESKQIFDQKTFFNNLTAQVGEGGGGGIASYGNVSSPVKTIGAQPAASTTGNAFAPLKINIAKSLENKIIAPEKVRKAAFSASVSYYKNIAGQFMRSLRTRTGAMTMAVNLSLANPVMLNAASSGKIMPIIETISSYDRAAAGAGKLIRGFKTAPLSETVKILADDVKLYKNAFKTVKGQTPISANAPAAPLKKSISINHLSYANLALRVMPKYIISSSLWLSTLTFPANSTPVKPVVYLREETIHYKNEYTEGIPLQKANMGYQALTNNALESIENAVNSGKTISAATIAALKETFGETYSDQQLQTLSSYDNIDRIMLVASTISKSLFDKMLSLITTADAEKDAANIIKNKNKKGLDKLLAAKAKNNRTFNNFFDALMAAKENNPYAFFTLNNEKPLPKESFSPDAVVAQGDILPTMIKSFFKTKSLKDITIKKTLPMTRSEKDLIISRILTVGNAISSMEQNGYVKGTVKPVLVGSKYQWEEINTLKPQNIVISVEIDKGDIGLEIAKWIEKRNIPSAGEDYFKHIPAWIADQLGLSTQNPGLFTIDKQSFNYFIYNADGTARVRFGPHEINPVDPHIHIERLNTNGEWDGIINEAYHSGPAEDIKTKAERARSLFEQTSTKTESQINHQAEDVGIAFMPVAAYLGSMDGYKAAADISKAVNKPQAVKNLLKTLEQVSTDKYFLNHLNELKAQGLVK